MTNDMENAGRDTAADVDRWVEVLRADEQSIEQDAVARLAAARRAAVAAVRTPWYRQRWVLPSGVGAGFATAALVVALILSSPVDTLPVMAEDEMLAAQEVELLEELEFAAWLVMLEENDEFPQG